jgi:dihydroorotase
MLISMKQLVLILALAGGVAAQPVYDLLLKGGHVIDPKNNINSVMDVGVADGKIARVAANIPAPEAKKTVNVAGLYVTPGLIDIHVHVYDRSGAKDLVGVSEGVQPDSFSFRSGVTTMVDAGSSGSQDFPDFRKRVIDPAKTRVLAFLNIVSAGMGTGKEDEPELMDVDAAAKTAKANSDIIVGFKSAHYAGKGWESIDAATKAGRQTDLPVMVDFGRITATRNIRTLLADKLRPGDIYTHCYSGHREELLENGKVNPAMRTGRERGIFFDLGFGAGSFYWYVAVPFYQQGFRPDSISTDLHKNSMNGGMKTMANTMSEVLALGSPFDEVIRMSTWNPAKEIKRTQLGNLDVGAEADVAVLRLDKGKFGFLDSAGARNSGTQTIVCELTLRKGKVSWDLNGRASEDWKNFQYQKRSWVK